MNRQEMKQRTHKILSNFGYGDLDGTMDSNGMLKVDGEPQRVKSCADALVKTGRAILVKFENGDDLNDEDFAGWGYAHLQLS